MSQIRQLASIMFTDIVGYSTLMGSDEERAIKLLEKSRQIQQPLVNKYGGQWIKEMGDGVIMIFQSVLNAVQCAIEIQKAVQDVEELFLKIAIHIGEIIVTDQDLLGDGVNLTARLEQIAQKNSILLSGRAFSDIKKIKSITTIKLGRFDFKNIAEPVTVFAIVEQGLSVPDLSGNPRRIDDDISDEEILSHDDQLVHQIMEVIENNLTNPQLSVSYLSQEVGISQPQLYRKIQAGTRHSPSDLIREVRLKKAALLLKGNVSNVSEVAYQTGFNNLSYFSKCFLEKYGSTPSDYRKTVTRKFGLPIAIDKFIGRDQEVEDIIRIMQGTRLLTLTGTGGTGKTRLAIEILTKQSKSFQDGVYFVQLAPVNRAEAVIPKIAQILKIQQNLTKNTLISIVEFFGDREVLLVLDNFEHVLEAASEVNQLILSCPSLKILVTSRVILNLASEAEYPVPQLPFPENGGDYELVELMKFPAVALLVTRAQTVKPDFELTRENRQAICTICAQLDGLPLALELAAARFKLFSPEALLRRLDNKLDILSSTSTDRPDRHKTLRSAIDWSYSLLSPEEQTLFRRLSVFSGGCTLEAAEEVCFKSYSANLDIIDQISGLVDKSLLQREDHKDGEPRFFMLETVKAFGQDRLDKSLEKEDLMQRYVDHTVALVEKAHKHLTGADQVHWLNRLEPELDNIRAVLFWAEESKNAEIGLKVVASFWRYWNNRSMMHEGASWIQRMLDIRTYNKDSIMRCRALNAYGTFKVNTGQLSEAHSIFDESLSIARETKYKRGMGDALTNLAWICRFIPDIELCREYSKKALEIHTELDDHRGMARVYNNLSAVEHLGGNISKTLQLVGKALHFRNIIGDKRSFAFESTLAAWYETYEGNFDKASLKIDTAIEILTDLYDNNIMAWALNIKAFTLYGANDIEQARELLTKAQLLWENEGNPYGVAQCHLFYIHIKLAASEIKNANDLMDKVLNDSDIKLYGINTYLSRHIHSLLKLAQDKPEEVFDDVKWNLKDIVFKKVYLFISDELELMAHLLIFKNSFENALLLFSLSTNLRVLNQMPVMPVRQGFYDNTLSQLKSHFDSSTFDTIWEKGRNLTPEECLTLLEPSLNV